MPRTSGHTICPRIYILATFLKQFHLTIEHIQRQQLGDKQCSGGDGCGNGSSCGVSHGEQHGDSCADDFRRHHIHALMGKFTELPLARYPSQRSTNTSRHPNLILASLPIAYSHDLNQLQICGFRWYYYLRYKNGKMNKCL